MYSTQKHLPVLSVPRLQWYTYLYLLFLTNSHACFPQQIPMTPTGLTIYCELLKIQVEEYECTSCDNCATTCDD